MRIFLFIVVVSFLSLPIVCQQVDADFLLRKADDSRSPYTSFREQVAIYTIEDNVHTETTKLDVIYRLSEDGNASSLAIIREPDTIKGRLILMNEGITWLQVPGSSGAIRISLAQRLSGGVSTGDILSINYKKDYSAVKLEDSIVNDTNVHVLELTAITNAVTYYRVRLYMDVNTYLPQKAEYISKTGTTLKTCLFTSYVTIEGKSICNEMRLVDKMTPEVITVIRNSKITEDKFPDRYFNPKGLKDLVL